MNEFRRVLGDRRLWLALLLCALLSWGMGLYGTRAVSYTHLDVYKRQGQRRQVVHGCRQLVS